MARLHRKRGEARMWYAEVILLGLVVGVLVGLMGIGGGVVLVPALVFLLHMCPHAAQGAARCSGILALLAPAAARAGRASGVLAQETSGPSGRGHLRPRFSVWRILRQQDRHPHGFPRPARCLWHFHYGRRSAAVA